MRASFRLALAATALAAATTAACRDPFCSPSSFDSAGTERNAGQPSDGFGGSSSGGTTNVGNAAPASVDASRVVSEADIVQLDQEQLRIYAMTKSGAVAIVDAATPGMLTLLGKSSLSGEPFEMYRRGDVLLTMSNRAINGSGQVKDPLPPDEGITISSPDPTASAALVAVNVADPAQPKQVAAFKVPGEIADSRIVGNVLYLATFENVSCYGCNTASPRTTVTTFDIADPLSPKQIDQIAFAGSAETYKRSVIATKERFYVGGANAKGTASDEGQIDVLDITDPTGHLVKGAHITVPGPITSRWQMDEFQGHLRVVSQVGVLTTATGTKYPDIDTFRIDSSSTVVRVGHTSMDLPRQEALKTVRFDGARAYAITFAETDPLFTIDLSNPAAPAQKGELVIPGWVFHLEPRGDRLLGLGLNRRDSSGNLNVSLFNVSDLSNPTMIQRVSFGPTTGFSDDMITQGMMAEDQDRIQKAFRIYSDGLIAVPFSGGTTWGGDACSANASGIQLLSWTPSTLERLANVPMTGNPRRSVRRDSDLMRELIAISDSNVRSFRIDNKYSPTQTADVVIGRCVPKQIVPQNGGGVAVPNGGGGWVGGEGNDLAFDEGSSCH
jgi:hypothetical protein